MAKKPFVVIDAELLSSSVWSEAAHVRLVWITLLILCDTDGYVGAALPGIATAAGVSLSEAEDAMQRLQEPDHYSRTQTHEGRRVAPAERGWEILNFRDHLDRLSAEKAKARDRVRKHRERKAMKRKGADSPVTVPAGSREKGIGTREENRRSGVGTSNGGSGGKTKRPTHPLADQTEDAIRAHRVRLERRLYELVGLISKKTGEDPVKVMNFVTSYKRPDGSVAGGVMRPELIRSDERLERSVGDAEAELKRAGDAKH